MKKFIDWLLTPFAVAWFIYLRNKAEHQMRYKDFDPNSDVGFSPFMQEYFRLFERRYQPLPITKEQSHISSHGIFE